MKRIEAIIRPEAVQGLLDVLKGSGYPGVMVTEIEGHGKQKGITQNWRGQEYKVDLLPKVKVEIIVGNDQVEALLKSIRQTVSTGSIGDGKVFVTDVTDALRIRTGERGDAALN